MSRLLAALCLCSMVFLPAVARALTLSAGTGIGSMRPPEEDLGPTDLGPCAVLRLDVVTWRPHERVAISVGGASVIVMGLETSHPYMSATVEGELRVRLVDLPFRLDLPAWLRGGDDDTPAHLGLTTRIGLGGMWRLEGPESPRDREEPTVSATIGTFSGGAYADVGSGVHLSVELLGALGNYRREPEPAVPRDDAGFFAFVALLAYTF
jgi:hypothetical protein